MFMLRWQVLEAGVCIFCILSNKTIYTTINKHYPKVTSFDALKQSTGIFAHLITFSSRKFIKLNKLSRFQSRHTFWEVIERHLCLKYRCQRVYVCRHHYFDRHQFQRLSLAVAENDVFTVVQTPVFTGCTLYCISKS